MSELTDEFGGRPYYPYAQRWCEDLFKSGSETTASVRSFKGPLIDDIQHVLETTSEMLELIEPDLKPEYLQPTLYIVDRDKILQKTRFLNSLTQEEKFDFLEISDNYKRWLGAVGYLYAKSLGETVESPVGILDDTPFKEQTPGGRTCAMQCFSMIAEAISKQQIPHQIVFDSVTAHAGVSIVDFDFYINLLCSDFMRQECGVLVTPINMTGATLGAIHDLAKSVKTQFKDARVYCTVPIRSDKFDDYWHQVILLGDDETGVFCNNPGGRWPMPKQRIPKLEFYERWSTCLNMAHLFIVQDT